MIAASARLYRVINGKPALKRRQEWLFWSVNLFIAFLLVSAVKYVRAGGSADLPKLKIQANQIAIGVGQNGENIILCHMEIRNAGSPSSVRDWRMDVFDGKGQPPMAAKLLIFSSDTVQVGQTNSIVLQNKELLPNKGLDPITRGGTLAGYVIFTLQGVDQKYLGQPGTLYRVYFKDVEEREYICDWTMTMALKPFK